MDDLLGVLISLMITTKNAQNPEVITAPQQKIYQTPTPTPRYSTALASYYDRSVCQGRVYGVNCKTASGEIFDDTALTVASRSYDFGTLVEFQYAGNSVICRVSDRGPYVGNRSWDLSYGCAEAIGLIRQGVGLVKYRIVE